MQDFDNKLEKYAEVIIHVGLNLRAGQRLLIGAPMLGTDGTPLEVYPLVRKITAAAYQAGARYVGVNWDDEELQRIRLQNAPLDTMGEGAFWKNDFAVEIIDNGDAFMGIIGQSPDLLKGLDAQKVKAKQLTDAGMFQKRLPRLASNLTNWLVVSAPTTGWANVVFPDMPLEDAKNRLWEAIFDACRVNQDDPLVGWEHHLATLRKSAQYLNKKRYTALHYRAPGTDLTVGLIDGHIWHGADLASQNGIRFVANLPTEEVFTAPHKDRVNGVVTATRPLSHAGSLIDGFTLTFANGRVVNASAKTGQEALDNLLNTDPASRMLGEVALVPHSSPISQSGLLFYNTLFDENASDHLALGSAYRFSVEGGERMSAEEFAAAGGNESKTHADFMIGSGQMDVDGILADGRTQPVMRAGEWAFI